MPVVVAGHPGQVRRQRLDPAGGPGGPLGQPRHLGVQPDQDRHGQPDSGQPEDHQHHRERLHDVAFVAAGFR